MGGRRIGQLIPKKGSGAVEQAKLIFRRIKQYGFFLKWRHIYGRTTRIEAVHKNPLRFLAVNIINGMQVCQGEEGALCRAACALRGTEKFVDTASKMASQTVP